MDQDSVHMVAASKVPMLKPGEYELWRMRMEQYIQMIDYSLWEVIENGNAPPVTKIIEGVKITIAPATAEENAHKRLELKARNNLLMGISNEHQLKFNSIKDAKLLLQAVEKSISQEDVNLKFLKSLSPEWNTHTIVWRNKPEIDTLSLNDLYNNMKIYESEVKGTPSSSTNTQNVAFVSSNSTNSINRAVNTAHGVTTASTQATAVNSTTFDKLSDAVIYWSDQHKRSTNFALMAYTSTSSNSEVSTDSNYSSPCLENVKILKEQNKQLLKDLRISKLNAITYKTEVAITYLRRKLDLAQKQKDEIQLTIEKLENSSKSLSKLIDCQIVDKCKTCLGYNVVPPPYTGNFMPLKPDLSFFGLEEFVYEPIVSEPTVKKPVVETSEAKTSKANPKAKIKKKIVKPSFAKIEFVKSKEQVKYPRKTTINKVYADKKASDLLGFGKPKTKGNPQMDLQNQGVIDSRCSSHMTGNMSYLTDFEELDYQLSLRSTTSTKSQLYFIIINGRIGKFDGKADEGFFVGYSLNSKAFRVFNSRTRIVEENLHIRFSENTLNVVSSGPDWLFDIDALTRTMNYEPIVAGTQSNGFAGTKANENAGQARMETGSIKDYILLPLWTVDPPFSQDLKNSQDDGSIPSSDDGKKVDEYSRKDIDPNMHALEDYNIFDLLSDDQDDGAEADMNNLDTTIQVSPNPTTRIHKNYPLDQVIRDLQSTTQTRRMSKNLEEHRIHKDHLLDQVIGGFAISYSTNKNMSKNWREHGRTYKGTKWVFRNNKDKRGIVIKNKARLVAQGYTQEERIDYDEVFAPVARI
ncbi:putative ribonuclease H-like domain-containing protein [Tanacetum coccineum]